MARTDFLIIDGERIHSLDELYKHFNRDEIQQHLHTGRFIHWLQLQCFQGDLAAIASLDTSAEDFDLKLLKILCCPEELLKLYVAKHDAKKLRELQITNKAEKTVTQVKAVEFPKKTVSMAKAVVMPKAGNSVEECVLSKWTVKVGDQVAVGQKIAEIETDKTSTDVESTEAGTVLALLCKEQDWVPVFTNIMIVGNPGDDFSALIGATPAPVAVQITNAKAIVMPKAGNSVDECILSKWRVKAGDVIKVGDIIADAETDKTSIEIEATAAGTVLALFSKELDVVPVLQNICAVGNPGDSIDTLVPKGLSPISVLETLTCREVTASIESVRAKILEVMRRYVDKRKADIEKQEYKNKTDGQSKHYHINENCVNCGGCLGVCSAGVIKEIQGKYCINADECIGCGACADECPFGAIVSVENDGKVTPMSSSMKENSPKLPRLWA